VERARGEIVTFLTSLWLHYKFRLGSISNLYAVTPMFAISVDTRIAKVQEMSFLSHTWKNQQSGFSSSRAESVSVRAWRFDSPIIKELCKVALVLIFCLATMTAFVALGVWIWIPYSHQ
jgi:hypothetical protein